MTAIATVTKAVERLTLTRIRQAANYVGGQTCTYSRLQRGSIESQLS